MTRLPAEAQRISYAPEELPDYAMPLTCAHPFCNFKAEPGGHHVVRRSYTQGKGPQDYISIDGEVLPNKVGLCRAHHQMLTENRALILFEAHTWCWYENDRLVGTLGPLPLTEGVAAGWAADALGEREPDKEGALRAASRSTNSEGQATLPTAGYELSPAVPAPSEPPAGGASDPDAPRICPTCGRKPPKPKSELEPARPKATWSIKVPVDERENGYALLNDLLEQCQEELGREGQPKYYALLEVLYGWLTGAKEKVA